MNSYKDEFDRLSNLPSDDSVDDWVYGVESLLSNLGLNDSESDSLISKVKFHKLKLGFAGSLLSLFKSRCNEYFGSLHVSDVSDSNSVFVAMWFDESRRFVYDNAIKSAIESFGLQSVRIDDELYNGDIVRQIEKSIDSAVALVADLTGGRTGVYYEAGIARGLMLCNHRIQLILVCDKVDFDNGSVHFDVLHENIIIYNDIDDLRAKLLARLQATIKCG